jgi:hypothetical protein
MINDRLNNSTIRWFHGSMLKHLSELGIFAKDPWADLQKDWNSTVNVTSLIM